MIELTAEQHQILSAIGTEPAHAHDPVTNEEYVLVRAEVYERIKTLIADDDEWPQLIHATTLKIFARDGWDDPRMDAYNALDPRKNP